MFPLTPDSISVGGEGRSEELVTRTPTVSTRPRPSRPSRSSCVDVTKTHEVKNDEGEGDLSVSSISLFHGNKWDIDLTTSIVISVGFYLCFTVQGDGLNVKIFVFS